MNVTKTRKFRMGVYKVTDSKGQKSVVKTSSEGLANPAHEGISAHIGETLGVNTLSTTVYLNDAPFTKNLLGSLGKLTDNDSGELMSQLQSVDRYIVMDYVKGHDLDREEVSAFQDLKDEELGAFPETIGRIWFLDTLLGYTDRKKENYRFGGVSGGLRKIYAIDRTPGQNSFIPEISKDVISQRLDKLLTADINAVADDEKSYLSGFEKGGYQFGQVEFREGFKKGVREALGQLDYLTSGYYNQTYGLVTASQETLPQTLTRTIDKIKRKKDAIMQRWA